MVIKILIALAVFVVTLLTIILLQPSEYRVERSRTISAPASAVFAQVNDFHRWDAWSPWAKIDPAMKASFEGPPAGVGAIYSWSGNDNVGAGRMTITESHADDLVRINLVFFKPFASTSAAEFTFKPNGEQTTVTWSMSGQKNFFTKAIHLLINMDKMLGGYFEQGLTQMKSVTEGAVN
jgi:polyketide cyclase/dehydrase/lipid transport protein